MSNDQIKYMFMGADVIFVLIMIAALWVRYKINERRFNRRNVVGMEIFDSYGNSFITRFWEGAAYKIAGFFLTFMVVGLLGSLFFILR